MYTLTQESGRVRVSMRLILLGDDLCVLIAGGDAPHIGAVTLSTPRPSLRDPTVNSASTSVLCRTGHRDDEIARFVSARLSARLNRHVAAVCGIHVDSLSRNEIDATVSLVESMVDKLVQNWAIIAINLSSGDMSI